MTSINLSGLSAVLVFSSYFLVAVGTSIQTVNNYRSFDERIDLARLEYPSWPESTIRRTTTWTIFSGVSGRELMRSQRTGASHKVELSLHKSHGALRSLEAD
jgi:hypothetical protein